MAIYLKRVKMKNLGCCESVNGEECWFKTATPINSGLYSCNTKYKYIKDKYGPCGLTEKIYIQIEKPEEKQ